MKRCEQAFRCCYGNAYVKDTCAYDENLTDEDPCPRYGENMENFIAKVTGEVTILEDF